MTPLGRLEDPVVGWIATVMVGALALFLRLWRLGSPKEFEFDETYYAKDAWSMLQHGYVRDYVDKADDAIIAGDLGSLWDSDKPRSEEHTSELQSLMRISYAVFCLKKKKKNE